jgi:hypothetical protein
MLGELAAKITKSTRNWPSAPRYNYLYVILRASLLAASVLYILSLEFFETAPSLQCAPP